MAKEIESEFEYDLNRLSEGVEKVKNKLAVTDYQAAKLCLIMERNLMYSEFESQKITLAEIELGVFEEDPTNLSSSVES